MVFTRFDRGYIVGGDGFLAEIGGANIIAADQRDFV
jgi:hypothetical protein